MEKIIKIIKNTRPQRVSGALAFACLLALAGCSGDQPPDDPALSGTAVTGPAVISSATTSPAATSLAAIRPAVDSADVASTQLSAAASPFEGKDMAVICAGISEEVFFTIDKLGPRMLIGQRALLLRFAQSNGGQVADDDADDDDDDDDGQVTGGAMKRASVPGSLQLPLVSVQRWQDGDSDDVMEGPGEGLGVGLGEGLGDLIGAINECKRLFPSEFAIVADDDSST